MPPVLGPIQSALSVIKVWAASSALNAFVLNAAISVGLSVISSKLFGPKLSAGAGSGLAGRQVMSRSATDYRRIVYGQSMLSGPIVYNNTSGNRGEYLWYVVALADGEVEDYTAVWFDGDAIPKADIDWTAGTGGADGTGTGDVSTAKWIGENSTAAVSLYYYTGHADQVAPAALVSAFGSDLDSNFRGRGVSYLIARFLYDEDTEEVWSDGPPRDIKALIKGRKVYDPRLDSTQIIDDTTSPVTYGSGSHRTSDATTWAWSDNPALCVADYLVNFMGVDAATGVNWVSIADGADDCDVVVDIPPSPGTETRFTCNGSLSLGDSHKNNLDALLSSCDGRLGYSQGVWKFRASVWEASSVSLGEDDLAGPIQVRGSAPKTERYNNIKGFFVDPDRKYEVTEFPYVSAAAYLTRDANQVINRDLSLPMTNSQYMAQRIAYRILEQGDNQVICTVTLNSIGAKVSVGDVVDLTISHLSWTSKNFRVIEWASAQEGTFTVTLKEDDSSDYTDPLQAEYATVGANNNTIPADVVPAPTSLTAAGVVGGVQLSWTNPPSRLFKAIEIHAANEDVRGSATLVASTTSNSYYDLLPQIQRKRYYWIRAVGNDGITVSDWEPNATTTTASAYPLLGQRPIVPDPLIRAGSSLWSLDSGASYVVGGGVDGTDAISLQSPYPNTAFATFAARRGPDEWDAYASEGATIEVRLRAKLHVQPGNTWSEQISVRAVVTNDASPNNETTYIASGGHTFNQASTAGEWFDSTYIIELDEEATETPPRYIQIQIQVPKNIYQPTYYVDIVDATFTSGVFRPSATEAKYFGLVPDTGGTTTARALLDDGTWGDAGYAKTAAETTAGVTIVDYTKAPGSVLRYGENTTPGTTDLSTALQAAIDQNDSGGAAVQLPPENVAFGTTLDIYTGTVITGHGQSSSTLTYTGSAQAFVNSTPSSRIYNIVMRDFYLNDTGTGTIGLDLSSVSTSQFDNVQVNGFTTSVKINSPTSGYAVYNRFYNVKAQNATTGFLLTGTSSNANSFISCRANICTTAASIVDSNDNSFISSQFESGTDGVKITASVAGVSDNNHIIACRFENNSGDAINIGSDVRQTVICENYFVSTGGSYTDNGTRTITFANGGLNQDQRIYTARDSGGNLYYENGVNATSSQPLAVFKDSGTSAGTPSTVEVHTERNAGVSFSVNRGGSTYFAVTPAGSIRTANTATNTNTPSGATAHQLPIYNAAGTLLGYIPIYGSAW